jgi:hypothetical protein
MRLSRLDVLFYLSDGDVDFVMAVHEDLVEQLSQQVLIRELYLQ